MPYIIKMAEKPKVDVLNGLTEIIMATTKVLEQEPALSEALGRNLKAADELMKTVIKMRKERTCTISCGECPLTRVNSLVTTCEVLLRESFKEHMNLYVLLRLLENQAQLYRSIVNKTR